MNVLLKYSLSVIIILLGVTMDIGKAPDKNQTIPAPYQKPAIAKEIMVDVPLINQMDAPRLYNGCEVTSLAMLLQFWGVQVSKNELAEQIPRVPLRYSDGKYGNPNDGFVGNMEDGPGLGVYHEPVFELAQSHLPANLKVTDLTNHPFDTIIEKLNEGLPVWVITTSNFSPVSTMQSWTTPQGSVEITYNMHSAVITGFDHENIYLNNPYGIKNQQVNKANFLKSWKQMGSQAIVVEPVKK
jgi:uncharacterized protein YvpB